MKQVNHSNLKIKNKLPQILLPKNKIQMFIDWYNEDIRFQDSLPKAFNEGYVIIENDIIDVDLSKCNKYIKHIASEKHTTYRKVESMFNSFINNSRRVTLYFKIEDKHTSVLIYGKDGSCFCSTEFMIGPGKDKEIINHKLTELNDWDELLCNFYEICVYLFGTCMWYIATTTKTTKYYREQSQDVIIYKDKKKLDVKTTKQIITPIYDLNKIRRVKVEHLIRRREGFTYAQSFMVHGHYRHYKDGKTIFINSYIKGKDKPFVGQKITLNPSC